MGSLPGWFDKKLQEQNRRSKDHERKVANETGGRVSAGSGSSWRSPQDVKSSTHLISHKYTDAKSFTIDLERDWLPLIADANRAGREPALFVNFDRYGKRIILTEG